MIILKVWWIPPVRVKGIRFTNATVAVKAIGMK